MTKFLYFTDYHLRLSSPSGRRDNLKEEQVKKLKFIRDLVDKHDCDFVLCGGDFGDGWDWKISLVYLARTLLSEFKKPVYTVIGNHDTPSKSPRHYVESGLGTLESTGTITVLNNKFSDEEDGTEFTNEPLEIANLLIYGFHADTVATKDFLSGKLILPKVPNKINVAVIHASVGPTSSPFWQCYKDVKCIGADLALFGDIHEGWPADKVGNTISINPGSLSRIKVNEKDFKPKVLIITIEGSTIKIQTIIVPHNSADIAFYPQIVTGSALAKELYKFSHTVDDKADPVVFLTKLAKKHHIRKEAIDLLKEELLNG